MMSLLKRSSLVAGTVTGLMLALAGPAAAHVTVNPDTAAPGGYTKVTFRVPNETDDTDTTRLEVDLPAAQAIASVSVKPVPGWAAVAVRTKLATPIRAHDRQLTEAVTRITWTARAGAEIRPGQFQEFDVSLGPLPDSGQMIFKALQTYSDSTVVRWIDEPTTDGTEPEHPAPVLKLAAAPAPPTTAPAAPASGVDTVGVVGLILAGLALVLGLLAYRRAARLPGPVTAAAPAGPAVPAARS
jgi:uncharacterized protein YcnI